MVEYMEMFNCWFFAKIPSILRREVTASHWYAVSTGCGY